MSTSLDDQIDVRWKVSLIAVFVKMLASIFRICAQNIMIPRQSVKVHLHIFSWMKEQIVRFGMIRSFQVILIIVYRYTNIDTSNNSDILLTICFFSLLLYSPPFFRLIPVFQSQWMKLPHQRNLNNFFFRNDKIFQIPAYEMFRFHAKKNSLKRC